MGENTKIEWAHHTFNPWVGCTKISPACDHCYAESWAKRAGTPELWNGKRRRTSTANWKQPLKWNREAAAAGVRARVFCASLADVFDNAVPDQWRADLFALIRATPYIDWLLLTKRIGNAPRMIEEAMRAGGVGEHFRPDIPWQNVWLGATVVTQEEADRDIPKLLATPARIRFLSIEPMLRPINLNTPFCRAFGHIPDEDRGIDWVIVGGESGAGARPMHPAWARSLRDQCATAGVPFLFKQWGEWIPMSQQDRDEDFPRIVADGAHGCPPNGWPDERVHQWPDDVEQSYRCGKHAAGRLLDGIEHNGFPA